MELVESLKHKVETYKVPTEALAPIKDAPMLFTVGITAAGKNAVLDRLLKTHADQYQFIVSHTTRPMRDYEQADVNYHFVDFPTIEGMIDRHEFIETDIVHADDVYGTSIREVKRAQDSHKIACTDLTIDGVDNYMALGLNAKAVFLLPPSYAEWKRRLMTRYETAGEVDPRDLRNRLDSALNEIDHALQLDHYYIVINDDLEKTTELVHRIAQGDAIEPHYHKAVTIAEEFEREIQAELKSLN